MGPNGEIPAPPRVQFRDGQGGDLPLEWASFLLSYWYQAGLKGQRPSFREVLKMASDHFIYGADSAAL